MYAAPALKVAQVFLVFPWFQIATMQAKGNHQKRGIVMALQVDIKKHILSPAQERVFKDLAAGMTYDQIAEKHHRTKETVHSHSKVIRETFEAHSMVEAVAKAIARGIISISEIGGKTMIAACLIVASGFATDNEIVRTTRTAKTTTARRIDEA